MMKIINQAFDALKYYTGEMRSEQTDYGDLLNDALNAIFPFPALVIEICGSWVWVTGETRVHKDTLKDALQIIAAPVKLFTLKMVRLKSGRVVTSI